MITKGAKPFSPLRLVALSVLVCLSILTAFGPGRAEPRGGVLGASASGGAVLDGWGGIHTFGAAQVNAAGAPFWPGWDIARSISVDPDWQGGYTLDGWGGVHPWGNARPLASDVYWSGWDIARSLVVTPDGRGGYIMDGWGGIHPIGNAPPLSGISYWPGWNIARGLQIHYNGSGVPDGGWQLDAWGGIHPFGGAYSLSAPHYYPGYPIFQSLHVAPGGAYELAHWGLVEQVGAPAGIDYTNYPQWGNWDIARDVALYNPNGHVSTLSLDRGAAGAAMALLHSVDRAERGLPGLTNNGTLGQIAGNGATYNVAACGGPQFEIGDRTSDMYSRNYFAHAIPGCSGTQYVFSTYMSADNVGYRQAGENIAWRGGDVSLLDDVWSINQMWLASPSHFANMMGPYSQIGCGVLDAPNGSYQGATSNIWIWACEFLG